MIQAKLTILLLSFASFLLHYSSAFAPSDAYFINCGSNQTIPFGSRSFQGDSCSGCNHTTLPFNTTSSIAIEDPDPPTNLFSLYHTARIFTSPFSYEFRLNNSQGYHLVRLHFFSFSSPTRQLSSMVFDVSLSTLQLPMDETRVNSTIGLTLLRSFRVQSQSKAPVIKEYLLRPNSEKITISFSPSYTSSAFVNAIEVFSVPDNLITSPVLFINPMNMRYYNIPTRQVLETIHRINVGGPEISPLNNSTDVLWRSWVPDEKFLQRKFTAEQAVFQGQLNYGKGMSREIAPVDVYATAQEMKYGSSGASHNSNLTWVFPVPSRFLYLVRLHFCDIVSTARDHLRFNVYINGYLAWEDLDLSALTGQKIAAPYYTDYVMNQESSGQVRVSVGPSRNRNATRLNAILNGVEIIKLNTLETRKGDPAEIQYWPLPNHPVASPAEIQYWPLPNHPVAESGRRTQAGKARLKIDLKKHVGLLAGSAVGGLAFFSGLITAILMASQLKRKLHQAKVATHASAAGRKIPLADILLATNNFDENLLLGHGGFGKVYKGVFKNGKKLAVKRSTTGSRQGISEFLTECIIFSKIQHRHLVSLIGYCKEESELILVYEFMENGTLNNHLYGTGGLPCLSWRQRLEICIGSARGLHYLHTGPSQSIIHRDIKSANILLDKNYVAKVADFGISKFIPLLDQSHVTTNVKGTFGYFDPQYFRQSRLTQKSDVYSFGVVLIEVLCARPAVDHSLPFEEQNLANWAMKWQKRGLLKQIVDPRIANEINGDSLRIFGEIAEKCLGEYGADRPTMGEVLWNLECALRLQDMAAQMEKPLEDS